MCVCVTFTFGPFGLCLDTGGNVPPFHLSGGSVVWSETVVGVRERELRWLSSKETLSAETILEGDSLS